MARVICPFCLRPHTFINSFDCELYPEKSVPQNFVKDYQKVPPLWLVTVGFSTHGKTTYLSALTLLIEDISKAWPGANHSILNQYTHDEVKRMRCHAKKGGPTPKTNVEIPEPLLINLHNIPDKGSRCLVMYDVAGQIYNSLDQAEKYVPALKQASTIWFFVSLTDLENDEEGKTLPDLFQTYLSGMEKLRIDLRRRNLIVVYTKGDRNLEFREYLMADPLLVTPENFSFSDYRKEMEKASEIFKNYTYKNVKGGAAFINMVNQSGMNLAFCVTSALGHEPTSDMPTPHRVLDPFLWALICEDGGIPRIIGLVADSSSDSQILYTEGSLSQIWEDLSDYGDVITYYLGQTSPASLSGQRAPLSPSPMVRQRLIGPILEQAPANSCLIVISTGHIVDLDDFYNSEWHDRLLLVTLDQGTHQDWPNVVSYRTKDDIQTIVNTLLRLYEGGEKQ